MNTSTAAFEVPRPASEHGPLDPPFLDITAPDFSFESEEVAQAQALHWYADTPMGMLILRYQQAHELVRDKRLVHDGHAFMASSGITSGPTYDWFVDAIVNHDGSQHRRLRGLINKAFTPRMVSNLRPVIRETARQLAEELSSVEECEFIEEYADRLSMAVMTELLGVPAEDLPIFKEWSSEIGLVFSLALGGEIPGRVEAAVEGLYRYVRSLMAVKAADPGPDLISALIATRAEDPDAVSDDELLNLVVTMVFAAHDTTRLQLTNAMHTFAQHPEQWIVLAENPDLTIQAVEEVMRWCPSSNAVFRTAADDLVLQGVPIPRGTMLMVGVQAAQRDPQAWPEGDRFDITVPREASVLQFGGGPHYCLGAPLARLELQEALLALTARIGAPRIAGEVSWRPAIGIYGPYALPLRFGAAQPTDGLR